VLMKRDARQNRFSKVSCMSTGIPGIDKFIAGSTGQCSGWPKGKISFILGRENSGKTTLALQTAVHEIKYGGWVAFFDYNHSLNGDLYPRTLGMPEEDRRFLIMSPTTMVLEALEEVTDFCDLVILDSFNMAEHPYRFPITEEDPDRLLEHAQEAKRLWNDFFRRIQPKIKAKKTVLLCIQPCRSYPEFAWTIPKIYEAGLEEAALCLGTKTGKRNYRRKNNRILYSEETSRKIVFNLAKSIYNPLEVGSNYEHLLKNGKGFERK
ncbi:MAG: hypothetical protein GF334_08225, partial [Candidatus Altiarchaeales archaeon]|nr:hypothetical protein [Candidatus Altiarchaeales archaeon]